VAASRLDWLALGTRANSERRSRYCPRSRSAIASDSGPHPAISAYNLARASRSQRAPAVAGRCLTWDAFNQIKERTPLLPPKLRLPYSELQALAVL